MFGVVGYGCKCFRIFMARFFRNLAYILRFSCFCNSLQFCTVLFLLLIYSKVGSRNALETFVFYLVWLHLIFAFRGRREGTILSALTVLLFFGALHSSWFFQGLCDSYSGCVHLFVRVEQLDGEGVFCTLFLVSVFPLITTSGGPEQVYLPTAY